jgi:hypothetical protein
VRQFISSHGGYSVLLSAIGGSIVYLRFIHRVILKVIRLPFLGAKGNRDRDNADDGSRPWPVGPFGPLIAESADAHQVDREGEFVVGAFLGIKKVDGPALGRVEESTPFENIPVIQQIPFVLPPDGQSIGQLYGNPGIDGLLDISFVAVLHP